MSESNPPLEVQRFGRSQTPESPRPMHIPEPSNIPVLENQMDPVFNDTATYDILPTSQANIEGTNFHQTQDLNTSKPFIGSVAQEPAQDAETSHFYTGIDRLFSNDIATDGPSFLPSSDTAVNLQPSTLQNPFQADVDASQVQTGTSSNQLQLNFGQTAPSGTLPAPQPLPSQPTNSTANTSDVSHIATNHSSNEYNNALGTQTYDGNKDGVDYQSLLEQVSKSASTAPSAGAITVATTIGAHEELTTVNDRPLQAVPGLPPKPPPQEYGSGPQAYSSSSERYYSQPLSIDTLGVNQNQSPQSNDNSTHRAGSASVEPPSATGANGMPPPPGTFSTQSALPPLRPPEAAPGASPNLDGEPDRPWTPNTQSVYDQFLSDERNYVTEGVWDKFPLGSRLFVGNLPTEKVTKRDLFHVFHGHGRLAQISIKQAYGFVQFLEAEACQRALQAEQSVEIRGRKIHLEVSKPQKNTRGTGGGEKKRRRSRSPDRGVTRERINYSDFRDEPGRRKEDRWQPGRSPSPRGHRSRDNYRVRDRSPRTYDAYDSRTRSPAFGSSYRSETPPPIDDDSTLPLPFRPPHEVPDVQILVIDDVAPQFVNYVEQGLRQKSLKASTIWLNARLPLAAVVKRQIKEGVQALMKLTRNNQWNSKVPLQVFDRVPGTSNVNFNEYAELDIPVAADIVIHQRQKERATQHTPVTPQYPPHHLPQAQPHFNYQQPPQLQHHYHQINTAPYQQPPMPQQNPQYRPTSQSSAIPGAGGANLQELLANLRQPSGSQQGTPQVPQQAFPPQNNRPTDLAGLLSNVAARQHNQTHPQPQQYAQQPSAPQQYQPYQGQQGHQQVYGQAYPQQQGSQNLQSIVEQLSRQAQ